jgi:hypothetical protein
MPLIPCWRATVSMSVDQFQASAFQDKSGNVSM